MKRTRAENRYRHIGALCMLLVGAPLSISCIAGDETASEPDDEAIGVVRSEVITCSNPGGPTDFTIVSVVPVVPSSPVNSPQTLHVTYTCQGTLPSSINIRVSLPGRPAFSHIDTTRSGVFDVTTENFVHAGQLPVTVELWSNPHLPYLPVRYDSKTVPVTPHYPTGAVEQYGGQCWAGDQWIQYFTGSPPNPSSLQLFIGYPPNSGWQLLQSASSAFYTWTGSTWLYRGPMYGAAPPPSYEVIWQKDTTPYLPGTTLVKAEEFYTVKVSNVRVNPVLANAVTWSQIDAIDPTLVKWRASEPGFTDYTAQDDPLLRAQLFAWNHLSCGYAYRQPGCETPWSAAKKLYIATVQYMNYTDNIGDSCESGPECISPADPDHDHSRWGGCGSYAIMWVTLLRSVGIPARSAEGYAMPVSSWAEHVWAEFYLPGVGWIQGDPQGADNFAEDSGYAYYLGADDALNRKIAMDHSYRHSTTYGELAWFAGLQYPGWLPAVGTSDRPLPLISTTPCP